MQKFKAIIIDDETSSRNALKQKINKYCKDLDIINECENGESGIEAIDQLKPDIVFLDVEMPRMNGFIMLQNVKNRDFELIFTTAYDHYAIRAIRYSALDYLVKPIDIQELVAATTKAIEKRNQYSPNERIETLLYNLMEEKSSGNRIAIPSQEGLQFVEVADIIYLEAESNYTIIYIRPGSKITIAKTLKDFEDLLPQQLFVRIHHSHIINKKHIHKYIRGEGGQVLMTNGKMLDVSRRKKDEFLKSIGC